MAALSASAQNAGELRFGVTGGMNVTNITKLDGDCKIGFNLGFRGEYSFSKNFYANAGLLWSMKGSKWSYEEFEESVNPSYIEIPIAVGGRYFIDKGLSIFAETGPYFAVGVCGKHDYFSSDDGAKRFDAGWGLRTGVEVNKFQVHLGYEHGFVGIYDGLSCKNWNFNIGVSYMF